MWVFGYGSLVWKVDFPYEKKMIGHIKGYCRRFWQGSEDHRGVPGKPGRVATLVTSDNKEDVVWGVAYKIADADVSAVSSHLEYREKGGYTQDTVTFLPQSPNEENIQLTIYIAKQDNDLYLGPVPLEQMAFQIFHSVGPSGKNKDYVYNLAEALRSIAPQVEDSHLFGLEKALKSLEDNANVENGEYIK